MVIISVVLAVASLTSVESSFVFNHIKTEFMPYNYTPTKQYGYAMGAVQKGAVNEEGYVFAVGRNLMHVIGWNWDDYISPETHEVLSGDVSATDVVTCGQYVAVSASDNIVPCQGRVYIYHTAGSIVNLVQSITVGTMPTKLLFTSDCKKLLVAIEGTPYKDHVTGDGFDPEGEVVIIDFETDPASSYSVRRADFTSFNSRDTVYMERGVRWVYKGENSSFTTRFSQDLEPEDITLNSDETIAYILLQENNAVATLDLASGVITELYSLGEKSWDQVHFDASDMNGATFGTWDIYSAYQPHSFKYINYNGQSYLVTANEGEQKEYNNGTHGITFRESFKGQDFHQNSWIAASVDSNLVNSLGNDNALGRLDISHVDYKDSNSQHYKFLAYGGRSISLFKIEPCGNISRHWDSGLEFEDVISSRYRDVFNGEADGPDEWYTNDHDKRSDNSGPEPKSIEVGEVNGKPLIFVGLEYPGLIAMYSVDPETATPTFQDIRFSCAMWRNKGTWREMYENRTCWDLDPAGLSFVPASKNIYGLPILVVFSTLSSTISFYTITDTSSDKGTCNPSPCLNGGTCVSVFGNSDRCDCPPGFTGVICQIDIRTAKVYGEPHYTTFDRNNPQFPYSYNHYDFHGTCTYVLSELCDPAANPSLVPFRVLGDNAVENLWQARHRVSVLWRVIVQAHGFTIEILKNKEVKVNGVQVSMPSSYSNPSIAGSLISLTPGYSHPVLMTDFGLVVSFKYGGYHFEVDVTDAGYRGKLCGLLGNNDGDPTNDFKLRNGQQTTDMAALGNDWKDANFSNPRCVDGGTPEVCDSQTDLQDAQTKCAYLNDTHGVFAPCHGTVDADSLFHSCVYDMCINPLNDQNFCSYLAAYASECAQNGIDINWLSASGHPCSCGANAQYKLAPVLCPNSCSEPDAAANCDPSVPLLFACVCNDGYLLSNDECVTPDQCGCTYNGTYYLPDTRWYVTSNTTNVTECQTLCTCEAGTVSCSPSGGCATGLHCQEMFPGHSLCVCSEGVNRPTDNCDEFFCAKRPDSQCDVTAEGKICPAAGNGHKLQNWGKKRNLALFKNKLNPCWTKVFTRTESDGSIMFAGVKLGVNPDPTSRDKHERTYNFDGKTSTGLTKFGLGITGSVTVDLSLLPGNKETFNGTAMAAEIIKVMNGYRLTASCHGETFLVFDYGANQPKGMQLMVHDPSVWIGDCFKMVS